MRVLVIGGTRFIGPPVVARLTDMGHEVTVFHRGQTEAALPPAIRHIHGDREMLADFAPVFARFAPDTVLDMAPMREADARTAIGAFEGVARRLVAISSMDVYRAYGRFHGSEPGPPESIPLTEEAALREKLFSYRGSGRGMDDYDKIPVERAVMGSPGLRGTVLRLPAVYGPGDQQHRLFSDLKRMDDGRPAILLEEDVAAWRWTRGYVENVADAVALAVTDDHAAGRTYNVGEPDALSQAEWVRAVGRAAGWHGEVMIVPKGRLPPKLRGPAACYDQDLVGDTVRIRRELGYEEQAPRDDALLRTIAWEREHRPAGRAEWFDYEAEDALLEEMARGRQ
jgi:nucleoside-diphosphate-sugar epimerase